MTTTSLKHGSSKHKSKLKSNFVNNNKLSSKKD